MLFTKEGTRAAEACHQARLVLATYDAELSVDPTSTRAADLEHGCAEKVGHAVGTTVRALDLASAEDSSRATSEGLEHLAVSAIEVLGFLVWTQNKALIAGTDGSLESWEENTESMRKVARTAQALAVELAKRAPTDQARARIYSYRRAFERLAQ